MLDVWTEKRAMVGKGTRGFPACDDRMAPADPVGANLLRGGAALVGPRGQDQVTESACAWSYFLSQGVQKT